MPQLGCLNGRISTSIFLRQPPKESLHLPFKLGCIFVHTVLLAAGPTPSPGYYSSSKPGSYSSPYPKRDARHSWPAHRPGKKRGAGDKLGRRLPHHVLL